MIVKTQWKFCCFVLRAENTRMRPTGYQTLLAPAVFSLVLISLSTTAGNNTTGLA